MDSVRVIPMTESEVLEANLRALGIDPDGMGQSVDDRVFAAYVEMMKARKDYVTARNVADKLHLSPSTITQSTRRLEVKGRGRHTINPRTSRSVFVPRVVP